MSLDTALSFTAVVLSAGMLIIVFWRGRLLLELHRHALLRNVLRIAFALAAVLMLLLARFSAEPDDKRRERVLYAGAAMAFLWCCCPLCSMELPPKHATEMRRLYDFGGAAERGDESGQRARWPRHTA